MNAQGDGHVKMTAALEMWLERSGAPPDLAIDLADVGFAGCRVDAMLRELITLDTANPASRERAADLVGEIHSWLFGELAHHVRQLEDRWTELESAIEPQEE